MPCEDVTEAIELRLDAEDRLADYRFSKRTCGQGVGAASLLLEVLAGRSADELLAATVDSFLDEFPIEDELEEFLSLKHLFAIQGALEVLTGQAPGSLNDAFATASVEFDGEDTIVSGEISVDLLTEKIESCGGCKGCGTARAKRAAATAVQ